MKTEKITKNLIFIIPIMILLILSLFNMYGASFISPVYKNNLSRQMLWIILGVLVCFFIYKLNMRLLLKYSLIFYILGIISLVLVLFIGRNVNGAKSWFRIGPISIQPSEIFKFFYILYLAKVASGNAKGWKLFLKIIILTFIPCILIFLEPDTGVVIMYLLMMFGVLLESKVSKKFIVSLLGLGLIVVGGFLSLYFFEQEFFIKLFGTGFFYRIDRLLSFTNNDSYQLANALIGIGVSGFRGLGLTNAKIYVPEITTDFVYTLTILNFGSIVGIITLIIYAFLLFRLYKLIVSTKKRMDKCIISSIFWMMSFQVCEHILMNLGLTPITGITLPFLSYGGSSLISYFMLFGLVFKINKKTY